MKRPRATFAPTTHALPEHENPLLALLVLLPSLTVTRSGTIDFQRSNPFILLQIADLAEESVQALNLGFAAVGNVWALAAPHIEDGTVPMDAVEASGWLLSTLGGCAASLLVLAAQCRQLAGACNG